MTSKDIAALPTWAKVVAGVGFPVFVALFLLNAIPGLPSPVVTAVEARIARLESRLESWAATQTDLLRTICKGTARPEDQHECRFRAERP